MICGSIFDQFLDDFGVGNQSKINQKSIKKNDQKQDASWDGFWMALGSIFGRCWAQVWGQVGVKLAPKSKEIGYQDDVKKSYKIWSHSGPQWYAVVRSGPQWSGGPGP